MAECSPQWKGWMFEPRTIEWIAVAVLGQERSPQPPLQKATFRLQRATNCRHQNQISC